MKERNAFIQTLHKQGERDLKALGFKPQERLRLEHQIEYFYVDALRRTSNILPVEASEPRPFDAVEDPQGLDEYAPMNEYGERVEEPYVVYEVDPVEEIRRSVYGDPTSTSENPEIFDGAIEWQFLDRQDYIISAVRRRDDGRLDVDVQLKHGIPSEARVAEKVDDLTIFNHLPMTLQKIDLEAAIKSTTDKKNQPIIKDASGMIWPVKKTSLRTHVRVN